MHTSPIIPSASRTRRIAMLLLAALLWTGAPLHAGPVTSTVSGAAYLAKGLVGLPFRIVSAAAKGVSKMGKTGVSAVKN